MESKNSFFRGLIFTRIEDNGPDVTFNYSNLDESQALSLVVQAFTLIGVGIGSSQSSSRTTLSNEGNLYGPMPVSGLLLSSLIFPFLIDDQASKDERVRKTGRSCAFIILVSRQMKYYDKLRTFLLSFMPSWTEKSKLDKRSIKTLYDRIEANEVFNIQSTSSNQSSIQEHVPHKALKSNPTEKKIVLLEHLVNLDSISKALVTMFESYPEGGTIDQLAKMAGMSRIMIGWNLRKYVKAGILKIEDNRIVFMQ